MTQEIGETKKAAQDHYRDLVMEKLFKLSQKQQAFFWKIVHSFGGSEYVIPVEKLDWASDLIERTIRKNEADPSRLNA